MAMSSTTPAVMASASSEKCNNASASSAVESSSQNNQRPVSSEGVLSLTSLTSILELKTSASNTKGNATDLIIDECVKVTNAEIS
nr:hypothetical protein CFP56_42690 [Quercus suber]